MRKITTLLLSLILLISLNLKAQKAEIPEEYNRSATTWILMVGENEEYASKQIEEWKKISFSEKFYDNNFDEYKIVRHPGSKITQADIEKYIKEEQLANKIIGKWYNRQEDGTLNMQVIHDRGLYNAIDADILKASNTKRGLAEVKDFGNQLINKSYIIVVDFKNIKSAKQLKKKDYIGFQGNLDAYVYKVDFNENVQYSLYDNAWIYEDDDEATKEQKKKAFDSMDVPVKFFAKKTRNINKTQGKKGTNAGKFVMVQKTDAQLFTELIFEGETETVFQLTRDHEDFRVKTTLNKKNPLSAKVGKKEDIKVDHRFFVFEYVYNEKKDDMGQKRRGVIRAKKVVDNRKVATGTSPMSTFYQTSGGKLEEGFLLQQRVDRGITIYGGLEIGQYAGPYVQVSYRTGNLTGIPSLYALGELYIPSSGDVLYGVGIAKGFYFARNFELQFSGSYGYVNDTDYAYIKAGASLAVNITHNFQAYGSLGAYMLSHNDAVFGLGVRASF